MSSVGKPAHGMNRALWIERLLMGLVLLAVQLGFQTANGAWSGEFGEYPDEAAHYVTGLMVHQYAVSGDWSRPLRFAENYYVHYPKMALGHWGPAFYALQGVWELLFGPSRAAVIGLLAVLSATIGTLIYSVSRPLVPRTFAFVAGLGFVVLPLTQRLSLAVMTELLSTLTMFAASLAFARYLSTSRVRDALGFVAWASVALLTKGNGFLLFPLPVLAVVLTQRWEVFGRASFWGQGLLVGLICGPWYWLTLKMQANGLQHESFAFSFVLEAIPAYARLWGAQFGPLLLALAAYGAWSNQVVAADPVAWVRRQTLIALVIAAASFTCFVPSSIEARHLLPAAPGLLVLAAYGLTALDQQLALPRRARIGLASLAAGLMLVLWAQPVAVAGPRHSGYLPVVDVLRARPSKVEPVVMVAADEAGDGMFVATMALRNPKPDCVVLRASKVLATSRWNGREYRALFPTEAEVQAYLEQLPTQYVVVDTAASSTRQPEAAQLRATLAAYPDRWIKLARFPRHAHLQTVGEIEIYELRGAADRVHGPIVIPMADKLGRTLELKPF